VPALITLGLIGVLALPRNQVMWFAMWCWLLSAGALPWILPGITAVEFFIAASLLVGIHLAGWKFVSLAADLLTRETEHHRSALEANRRLLDFEHALALCSRELLIGSGEEALEAALITLREAIGADRSYLAVNVDHEEHGFAFHVVKSASRAEHAEDEWADSVIPWAKYEVARATLAEGRVFRHLATEVPGAGWNRSVLTVPVFIDEDWVASVGFVDIKRRTVWSDDAVRMLEVAAPMLGTYWERETTRRRLAELVRSKDTFLASVSHELRTPLAAILGFAQELRSNAMNFDAEERAGMLEVIADQSQEMANMVEDLLVSARADIGTVSIRPQDVYLRSQAEAVLAGIGATNGKDIQVIGGRGKVWADPTRTRQIIRNLITNAIRYGGEEVVIEAVEGENHTTLTVADNGAGLERSQWEQIFEPYQRAHNVPTQPASIGLGLTVSRQLARLMDGDLVYSSDRRRSVFSLTLPARAPEGANAEVSDDDFAAIASP
jgi:signal transduction histidine kinase